MFSVFKLKQTLQAKKNFEKINFTFLAEFFCKKITSFGSNLSWSYFKFCIALFHSFEALLDCLENFSETSWQRKQFELKLY